MLEEEVNTKLISDLFTETPLERHNLRGVNIIETYQVLHWRHDIEHNGTQHNNTQHKIRYSNTRHNDFQHNNTQY
jgi:hypothetical protein